MGGVHTEHSWNELTDVAAQKAAASPELSATRHMGLIDPLPTQNRVNVQQQHPPRDCAFDITDQIQTLQDQRGGGNDGFFESELQQRKESTSTSIASANVGILSPGDQELGGATLTDTGRILALQEQLEEDDSLHLNLN